MSEKLSWAELLERINDLEKRLNTISGHGAVRPNITLQTLRKISQESETFDEYVEKVNQLYTGQPPVRPPTWADVLKKYAELDERLKKLEEETP